MKTTEYVSPLLEERYVCIEHTSGLPIYVFPKKLTTTCALFAVRYGSTVASYRTPDGQQKNPPAGVAHYLEHKLFENEDGSDSFARFAALGADANAYTSYDRTAYTLSCTERFDEALAELLRFVTHPHFTEQSVKKEQGIIAEEIRMYNDSPWERCFRDLLRTLYQKHPVRQDICGTAASIARITPKILYDCYHSFYTPQNMVLVVCGDVSVEQVLSVANNALPPSFIGGSTATPTYPEEPFAVIGKSRTSLTMPIAKPLFTVGIKDCVTGLSPDERFHRETAMSLLCDILFSRSGSLYNELFEEQLISPAFSAGYSSTESFAFTCLSGEADDPDRVFEKILSYVERIKRTGIDDEDFERCRRVLYADELRAYDSTEEIANRLLSFVLDGVPMFSATDVLQSLSKQTLEELLHSVYQASNYAFSVILPQNSGNPTHKN